MEVPDAVLEKLKCENCENYLSRGPVLMLDNERSRCGRCIEPEEGAKRNKPYEELAQLMRFPCRYKENGCEVKLRFEENKAHEDACAYRVYLCPIAESGKCEWSGVRGRVLEHCKTGHPVSVIENPVTFKHDITRSSLGNYLLFAFEVLFLVQTKVCTMTRKIYHSVRLFGDPRLAAKYTYDIDISSEEVNIVKRGKVAPEGCLALQEDSSVAMDINALLTVLDGCKESKFSLTVRSTNGEVEKKIPNVENENNIEKRTKRTRKRVEKKIPVVENKSNIEKPTRTSSLLTSVQVVCGRCKSMTDQVYQDYLSIWNCKSCAPKRRQCKHKAKGCRYLDYESKCDKHELYYCQYQSWCTICNSTITDSCLDEHYTRTHGDITYRAVTVFYEAPIKDWDNLFIIKCKFGNVICRPSGFLGLLQLWSPIPSEQLYMYKIVLEVNNLEPEKKLKFIGKVDYDSDNDWNLNIPITLYVFHQTGNCTYTIDFIKNENPADLQQES